MRLTLLLSGAALAAVFFFTPTKAQAGLVTNGSFETGDFTGWTTGGNFEDTAVVSGAFYDYSGAEDGTFYAVLGAVGSDGTLSQTLSTTLGVGYTFSFWINAVGDNPSDFSADWNGTPVYSQSDPNTGNVWTQLSFNVTGTGSDTIEFDFRDDPAYMALDNVSVSSASGVPEPGTLPLVLTGSLAMAGVIRRKLRASR
jgi:hypothetical protein